MSKKERPARVVPEIIVELMKRPSYNPLRKNEIFRSLRLPGGLRGSFMRVLNDLVKDGTVVRIRKDCFALPGETGLVVGILRANENGYGFVVPEDPEGRDVFIPPPFMSTAMHLDKVLVRLDDPASQRDSSKGPSGKIMRIVERGNPTVVGTLAASKQFTYVIPDDPRLSHDIYVARESLKGAGVGSKVVVRITEWPSKHVNPEGVIEEVLGNASDPKVDLLSIIKKYHYETQFPQGVTAEAQAIPTAIPEAWLDGRRDLRRQTIFTIDPVDAKDFDDAVSLEHSPDGYRLGVHIADVSFYVKEHSALDQEARGRGTSVYLPSCVLPMLPERLSNGVCSLKEKEDRLTKTVLFHCTRKGEIRRVEIFPSVIRSVKRFTYEEVLKIISEKDAVVSSDVRSLVPVLKDMAELASHLHAIRVQRGSIMLEIPKVKVLLDKDYRPVGIHREVQDQAHGLIEEFMLLANEAVARHITDKGLPCIFRVHEPPDKQSFEDFAVFMRGLGFAVHTQDVTVHEIQAILNRVKGKPEEPIVHINLLRSMKLAVYSNRNLGHFALALKFYSHFTSPIRRYPDLIVHRILDRMWARKKSETAAQLGSKEIGVLALHASRTERMADEAERELSTLKILQYLSALAKRLPARVYGGIITHIKSFGFFVEMEETLVDGVVHVSSIKDDFYEVDIARQMLTGRRRRRKFRAGQRVNVRIVKIDMAKRQVDLTLA